MYQKLNSLDKAEIEYKKVLAVAPYLVDALIGLGNTYVAVGEDLQKNGKAIRCRNTFLRALDQFALAIDVEGKDRALRRLSPAERAALSYSRGYANVMCFEAQTLAKHDDKRLHAALPRSAKCHPATPTSTRRKEPSRRSESGPEPSERAARWGAWIIVVGAFVTFVVANVAFLVGKPGLVLTFQVSSESLQALKAASLPDEVVAKLDLAQRGAALKAAFTATSSRRSATIWRRSSVTPSANRPLAAGPALAGVAGRRRLALLAPAPCVHGRWPVSAQLSKLKFGGIELEKTSETAAKVTGPLGITK